MDLRTERGGVCKMNIKLKSLRLKNFKGIKDLQVDFGQVTNILGENASGKTTIFDAFTWLLFDKDCTDRKDFGIKTFDGAGEVIHGLDHEVEGVLVVDGKEIILKKIYSEKWTKKRGEAERNLTGHTTDYCINDVPVKKSEYQDKINNLIDEGIFKLVTNPLYFNNLNWKDRRNILLEVVGDFSDEDVISSKESLGKLNKLLEGKELEEFKKMIAARRKKMNEELKSIPIRIDEINNSIEETDDVAVDSIEFRIRGKIASIKDVESQILDRSKIYENNSKINAEIYKKKDQLRAIEEEVKKKAQEPRKRVQEEVYKLEIDYNGFEFKISDCKRKIDKNLEFKNQIEKEVELLRQQWFEENEKTFIFDDSKCNCPTCGQDLPLEDIEQKKADMKLRFEVNKKNTLSTLAHSGKNNAAAVEEVKTGITELQLHLKILKEEQNSTLKAIESKKEELEGTASEVEVIIDPVYIEIKNEIKELEQSIIEPDEREINQLKVKKEEMSQEVDNLKYSIRAKEQSEKSKGRIKELQERERELANMIADLEGQEFLCEEFTRTKVDMLESRINSKFNTVGFKLFNTLVNGSLEETCETLIDGVPFADANNAAKINAGIDIINSLSEHYSITAPIFVDNRESVNDLIESNSQIVNLIVSRDKKINVEVA